MKKNKILSLGLLLALGISPIVSATTSYAASGNETGGGNIGINVGDIDEGYLKMDAEKYGIESRNVIALPGTSEEDIAKSAISKVTNYPNNDKNEFDFTTIEAKDVKPLLNEMFPESESYKFTLQTPTGGKVDVTKDGKASVVITKGGKEFAKSGEFNLDVVSNSDFKNVLKGVEGDTLKLKEKKYDEAPSADRIKNQLIDSDKQQGSPLKDAKITVKNPEALYEGDNKDEHGKLHIVKDEAPLKVEVELPDGTKYTYEGLKAAPAKNEKVIGFTGKENGKKAKNTDLATAREVRPNHHYAIINFDPGEVAVLFREGADKKHDPQAEADTNIFFVPKGTNNLDIKTPRAIARKGYKLKGWNTKVIETKK